MFVERLATSLAEALVGCRGTLPVVNDAMAAALRSTKDPSKLDDKGQFVIGPKVVSILDYRLTTRGN